MPKEDDDKNPDLEDDGQDEELETVASELEGLSTEARKEALKKLIEKETETRLAKAKQGLDKSYSKLDEIKKENEKLKSDMKALERKRLTEEGKHLEVANAKLSDLTEENRVLKERLTALTRDRELERHLSSLDFKNDSARSSAFKTIISDLVHDEENSEWVHKSGVSIEEFIKAFSKDPNNDFYFKVKDSNGAGSSSRKEQGGNKPRPASLKGLSTEEVIALAAAGKLGKYTL
jgi:vacuolar-type H+-ATPase subunit I/STV1